MLTFLPTLSPKKTTLLLAKITFLTVFTMVLLALPFKIRQYNSIVAIKSAIFLNKNIGPFANGFSPIEKKENKNISSRPEPKPIDTTNLKQSNWFASVKKDLDKRLYNINARENGKNYSSINAAQQLKTEFDEDGFTLYSIPQTPSKEDLFSKNVSLKNNWNLNMQVKGLYADGKLIKPNGSETAINNDNNVAYNFGNAYTVQYKNDEKGIRQNFIIKEKPSKNTHELKVRLHVNGDWVINKVHDKELHFAKQNNLGGLDNKITYNDLKVWDANGKTLSAKMIVDNDNNFEIVADAAGASYPVTIDPISTTPTTTLTNGGVTNFGLSVASAGDINGDGYSDVIVGSNSGSVSIYLGSLSGLSSTAAATLTGPGTFGVAVASAGDINKDGFSDILIGDGAGNVFIFNGSAAGIASGASTTASATLTGTGFFGFSVATAGDVNNDGYSDIIIGNRGGSAFIFSGSSTGIASGASTTASATLTGAGNFGISVATAGDINADGFSDVIVGDGGGGAFVFSGSASGVASGNTSTGIALTGTGSFFGASVSSAGDINGDGYSDVIVGNAAGHAFVYISSSGSISSGTTAVTLSGGAFFGFSVAGAGDVNGDAFSDVIVGDEAGNATIYYGTTTGLSTTASVTLTGSTNFGVSVASAGDVNGDGYSDVIVGAATSTSAFTYVGSPTGAVSLPTVTINGINAGDQFGYSVASAGDVNGDGYSDVIIGANGYIGGLGGNTATTGNLGAFFIYLGSATGLSTTPAGGTPISGPQPGQGANDGNFGISVASAGDVNGDGYGDVVIGGIGYNNGSGTYQGIAYVYFGGNTGLNGTFQVINYPGSANFAEFGYSVASAGDINGDGFSDVIISAPNNDLTFSGQGQVYVFLGSATGLILSNPTALTVAVSAYTSYGWSVASAGDVNGDGYDDVIVGGSATNAAYIYYGGSFGIANGALPNVVVDGGYGYGSFGYSVASAGDVNGDGFSDVIVGAPGVFGKGVVSLFLGSSSGTETTASSTFYGLNSNDNFGLCVASAGDVNGDGYSDILVKAVTGPVYLFQGSPTGFPVTVNSTAANITYTNGVDASADNEFQNHLSIGSAGDVNGDGYSDIIEGVYENNSKAGNAYVYYGNNAVGHNGSNVLHLYENNLNTNLAQDNIHSTTFGLGLTVQSPFGSVKGRMVWEVEKNGIPFSGNPITNSVISSGQQTAYTSIAPGGTLFKNIVNKAVGKSTKVRARIQYASTAVTFGQVYSPWVYSQVYLTTGTSNVLPLNLLTFTATPLDQNIVLNWKTAEEQNTKSFIIEHSLDDIHFAPLDSVNAKGNTTTTSTYDYTHYHPSVGIHYYRLKEEDLDGHYTISYVVHATILANGPQFSIYPNPSSDQLVVTYSGINQSNVIRIVDGAGNVVRQYSFNPNGAQTIISLKGVAKGTYFVQMVNSGFAPKQVSIQ